MKKILNTSQGAVVCGGFKILPGEIITLDDKIVENLLRVVPERITLLCDIPEPLNNKEQIKIEEEPIVQVESLEKDNNSEERTILIEECKKLNLPFHHKHGTDTLKLMLAEHNEKNNK